MKQTTSVKLDPIVKQEAQVLNQVRLNRTKIFIKDLQKISFSNEHYSKYVVYLGKLLSA